MQTFDRPTLAFEISDRVLLLVHADVPPSEHEWDEYVRFLEQHFDEIDAWLVVTERASPNPAQRDRLNRMVGIKGGLCRCAVVTRAQAARDAVSAIHHENPFIRAFAPEQLDSALAHLLIPATRRDELWNRVAEMRVRLTTANEGQTTHRQR